MVLVGKILWWVDLASLDLPPPLTFRTGSFTSNASSTIAHSSPGSTATPGSNAGSSSNSPNSAGDEADEFDGAVVVGEGGVAGGEVVFSDDVFTGVGGGDGDDEGRGLLVLLSCLCPCPWTSFLKRLRTVACGRRLGYAAREIRIASKTPALRSCSATNPVSN